MKNLSPNSEYKSRQKEVEKDGKKVIVKSVLKYSKKMTHVKGGTTL